MPLLPRLAAGALSAGLLVSSPAAAEPTRQPQEPAARCRQALDRRLSALDKASSRLASAKRLTDAQKAALAGILSGTRSDLSALAEEIASEGDRRSLKAHCQQARRSARAGLRKARDVVRDTVGTRRDRRSEPVEL